MWDRSWNCETCKSAFAIFFIPTTGHLTAQVFPLQGICNPRPKTANTQELAWGEGENGCSWNWLMHYLHVLKCTRGQMWSCNLSQWGSMTLLLLHVQILDYGQTTGRVSLNVSGFLLSTHLASQTEGVICRLQVRVAGWNLKKSLMS